MKIFVDTLFVVALISERDQHHSRARELADIYLSHQLFTTDAVLLEIGNALSSRFRNEAIAIISGFLSSKNVEVIGLDDHLFYRAFELYKTHTDKSWGLVDCLSFIVMGDHGVTHALTCDRHFLQAGFRVMMIESIN